MTSTREPDAMTPDERRQEVAAILARGLLRRVRTKRYPPSWSPQSGLHFQRMRD